MTATIYGGARGGGMRVYRELPTIVTEVGRLLGEGDDAAKIAAGLAAEAAEAMAAEAAKEAAAAAAAGGGAGGSPPSSAPSSAKGSAHDVARPEATRHEARVQRLREHVTAKLTTPRDSAVEAAMAAAAGGRGSIVAVPMEMDASEQPPPPALARLAAGRESAEADEADDRAANEEANAEGSLEHVELNTLLIKLPLWGLAESGWAAGPLEGDTPSLAFDGLPQPRATGPLEGDTPSLAFHGHVPRPSTATFSWHIPWPSTNTFPGLPLPPSTAIFHAPPKATLSCHLPPPPSTDAFHGLRTGRSRDSSRRCTGRCSSPPSTPSRRLCTLR